MKMAVDNLTLLWKQIYPVCFFYEKNKQGKQDIFTAIALFSNGGRSGRSGKYIFRKKWPHYRNNFCQQIAARQDLNKPSSI